jgi:chemotaxis protein MotB
MKHFVAIGFIAMTSSLLVSCGTGKKLTAANTQIDQLNSQVTTLNSKIAEDAKTISDLKDQNAKISKDAQDCNESKAAIAQKYDNMNKMLEERGSSIDTIMQKAQAAIQDLQDSGATVTYKHGLFHINFKNKYFFRPGSSKIGVRGRQALNLVAKVMRDNPNVTAIIVGNTDTTGFRGKTTDNWTLSTARANAVVRILRDEYSINPSRLISGGRSEYDPVTSNTTKEGREENRRIDILINPNFPTLEGEGTMNNQE